ncbi:hypothetical protein HYPSUDRAFT_201878 [Hypholoma sublateritium FD-334 SS-4]|uniref:Uncharacterized protein n=1 Tax=Hypholoma sublateritium (strain FD-334 SS-4) TaxID=945553 RepID=A0A0D2NVF3_HYPSF|nr:hypothetical protein HYPSUDRAFT_201878 [Hypholoma sublateritium FD-334 SS-4]
MFARPLVRRRRQRCVSARTLPAATAQQPELRRRRSRCPHTCRPWSPRAGPTDSVRVRRRQPLSHLTSPAPQLLSHLHKISNFNSIASVSLVRSRSLAHSATWRRAIPRCTTPRRAAPPPPPLKLSARWEPSHAHDCSRTGDARSRQHRRPPPAVSSPASLPLLCMRPPAVRDTMCSRHLCALLARPAIAHVPITYDRTHALCTSIAGCSTGPRALLPPAPALLHRSCPHRFLVPPPAHCSSPRRRHAMPPHSGHRYQLTMYFLLAGRTAERRCPVHSARLKNWAYSSRCSLLLREAASAVADARGAQAARARVTRLPTHEDSIKNGAADSRLHRRPRTALPAGAFTRRSHTGIGRPRTSVTASRLRIALHTFPTARRGASPITRATVLQHARPALAQRTSLRAYPEVVSRVQAAAGPEETSQRRGDNDDEGNTPSPAAFVCKDWARAAQPVDDDDADVGLQREWMHPQRRREAQHALHPIPCLMRVVVELSSLRTV